ncbi:MAG TPA: hypothetical protein PLX08_04670 [Bacteroidales bacterium]|jgi:hypothetical protein|nr:hypothetical protein [Bacteroidales bacterium]
MFKILILNVFLLVHPVRVTLTTLNKDPGSDTIRMSFRMYFDDFLLDYKLYRPEFEPGKINDPKEYFQSRIIDYFNERVQICLNGKLLPGTILGFSIDNYEIILNLAYVSDKRPKNLRIRNNILTSIYPEQANMVYLNIDRYENALKLTAENVEASIRIK